MKIIFKIVYFLHKLFSKHIPILSCYGCMNDKCSYRPEKGNMICYFYKKKNREIKTLVDLLLLEEDFEEKASDEE